MYLSQGFSGPARSIAIDGTPAFADKTVVLSFVLTVT
jgi:hypothetical protein